MDPIHFAAYKGHTEMVKYLASFPGDPNLPNNDGRTPFSYASQEGYTEIMKFLVQWSKIE